MTRSTTRQPSRPAPGASPQAASPTRRADEWREVTVPQGTAIPLELETPLSSETTQVEAPVRARVRQAVIVDGVVAIPTGATLSGVVTQVERAGRVQGRAQLAFVFNRLEAGNVREDVNAAPVAYVAESTKGEDAAKIGVGAVGGAIVGGILGGGSGAAKGAVDRRRGRNGCRACNARRGGDPGEGNSSGSQPRLTAHRPRPGPVTLHDPPPSVRSVGGVG